MGWIYPAQDKDHRWALANMTMSLKSKKAVEVTKQP
jgi:hypothetical protein